MPVSVSIFVAGNRVVEEQHQDCAIYRQDWRRRLLRVLDDRCWQLEAMEMERDWAEAKRRGEI